MADPSASSIATGNGSTAIVTCNFSAQSAGTLLVLTEAADDYLVTTGSNRPESTGWTLVQNQVTGFFGQAMWYLIAAGSETSVQFKIGSAVKSSWNILAVTNIDGTTPLNISNKGVTNSSASNYTLPTVTTPSGSGRCISIASPGASATAASVGTITAYTNAYTAITRVETATTPFEMVATAYLLGNRGSAMATTNFTLSNGALSGGGILAVFNGAAAGGITGDVASTLTLTGASAGSAGRSSGATSTLTLTAAAAGAAGRSSGATSTVTLTGAAAGATGLSSGATTSTVTLTGTATGVVGTVTGATSTVTLTGAAAGVVGAASGATSAVTLTGVAAGNVATGSGATSTLTLTGLSAGAAGRSSGATSTLTLTGTATGALGGGIAPIASTNGNSTTATPTITFPAYSVGDGLILVIERNQTSTAFTASAAVTSLTELTNNSGDRRFSIIRVVPNGAGQTTFTLTSSQSAVNGWWFANYGPGYDFTTVAAATNAQGSSAVSTITVPQVGMSWIPTGNELILWGAGVNSTAAWTTDSNTVYNTTSGNAAIIVDAARPTAGELTHLIASLDRGNNGSTRTQNSAAVIIQATPTGQVNLLSNPSFELGSTLATSWSDEHTTTNAATYSLVATGVVDGVDAQRIVYAGVAGDASGDKILEIYQAPIPAAPGQVLIFTVWLSGSVNTDAIVGIEGFTSGNVYISENDTGIAPGTLTGTPTWYYAVYTVPGSTDHVAAYYQAADIGSSTSIDVTLDKATLLISMAATNLNLAATATGVVGTSSGATSTLSLTGAAAGTASAGISGTVTSTVSLTGTATGAVATSTGATSTLNLAATATGVVGRSSGATSTVTLTGAVAGVSSGSVGATSTITLTMVAAGNVATSTGATSTVVLTGAAAGAANTATGSTSTITLTATATGVVGKVSGATSMLTLTGVSAGASAAATGATTTVTLTATAAGVTRVTGASTSVVTLLGVAAGAINLLSRDIAVAVTTGRDRWAVTSTAGDRWATTTATDRFESISQELE